MLEHPPWRHSYLPLLPTADTMRGIQIAQYVKVSPQAPSSCFRPFHLVIPTGPCAAPAVTHEPQGPKELAVTELPDPQPGPHDYLIEVHAAATNFFDILQIQGKYQNQPRECHLHVPLSASSARRGSVLTPSRHSVPLGRRC